MLMRLSLYILTLLTAFYHYLVGLHHTQTEIYLMKMPSIAIKHTDKVVQLRKTNIRNTHYSNKNKTKYSPNIEPELDQLR